jgi:hypothetical protein
MSEFETRGALYAQRLRRGEPPIRFNPHPPKIDIKRKYIHVRVRPPRGYHTYRVKDVGKPGGMKAVVGIKGYGAQRRSEVQKYLLDKRDVGVRDGRLYARTPRGRREIESLRRTRRRGLSARLLQSY